MALIIAFKYSEAFEQVQFLLVGVHAECFKTFVFVYNGAFSKCYRFILMHTPFYLQNPGIPLLAVGFFVQIKINT